ncbi:MAG TPA: response regulator transcription factor [Bacteroidia bacterium]|nr:response regulator transcription factor [Bacteroidia bacterium]
MNLSRPLFLRRFALYGIALALITVLLKWMEYRFLIISHAWEIYAGLIAVSFTVIGAWAGWKITRKKPEKEIVIEKEIVVVEKEVIVEKEVPAPFSPDPQAAEKLGISQREMEVLHLMAEGLSNQEIAGKLFVSLNTVKTHLSNLFQKLDVSRRTQAVQKARTLRLVK